jgi:hypothetical protein
MTRKHFASTPDLREGGQFWQTYTKRSIGVGQQTIGFEIPFAMRIEQVSYAMGTPDVSGTTLVDLRKNGLSISNQLPGTLGAAALTPTPITGLSVDLDAGDLIWAYISAIGGTAGYGLAVRFRGRRLA